MREGFWAFTWRDGFNRRWDILVFFLVLLFVGGSFLAIILGSYFASFLYGLLLPLGFQKFKSWAWGDVEE